MRFLVKLGTFAAVLVVLISSLGCSQQPEHKKIDFRNVKTEDVSASGFPAISFRLAAAGVFSSTEELNINERLTTYLSQPLNQPVELVQRRTYAEINDLVKSRQVDVAFVCGWPYVLGSEEFGMELLVVPEVNRETFYYSYIIVPAGSAARELQDLRNKRFAFADPQSNSGRLAPTYKLHQLGKTPGSFFGQYIFTGSHDNSVRAVAGQIAEPRTQGTASRIIP